MPALFTAILLVVPLVALAVPQPFLRNTSTATLEARAEFTLKDHYQGNDFLNWNFFSDSDPTHGAVNYLSKADAVAKHLAYVQSDGTTVLAVDSKTKLGSGQKRNSVRITSPKTYTTGLFIADIAHMPHGPTTWPAYWTVGPDWPNNGEIDIIEGVGDSTTNQMTIHTSSGCSLDTSKASQFTGKATDHPNCQSGSGDNDGCGITDFSANVYGHPFNVVGGGVFAHIVSSQGIKIWHFQRSSIPGDITSKRPNPDSWGKPAAYFSSSTCDISKHFKNQAIVFDTTLCGDWAGNVFSGGMSACVSAVKDPGNYQNAQWGIKSVSVYQ